ncbi:unnamed protein product [Adineta ricciae]|uniref:Polyketide synthase n=1 Tax=Adineta ricciae TaxID=249248 RepID=A0A815CHW9_ADIRI|nr:unnamed protein product [Adineta ricciae]CAF1476849.1 unnamed protein product [Adineta ricciae]
MTSSFVSKNALEPIAIIGVACEFAGDIHTANDLWNALKESRDVGSTIPRDRVDLTSYAAHMLNMDNGQLRAKLLRGGYFLSNNQWDMFEASFFDLSDAEAGSIDPCHRLLMLKFVHLIDDAGYSIEKINGTRTSVHIGQFSTDHATTSTRMEPEYRSRFHGPNSLLYNAAARIAYHFNLQGPNVSLDVACSSSLEAIHLAVQSLRTNESDMAVCGGVNALYAPENFLQSSLIGAQSPEGRSRSFSADANGYAKGDGLGLLLLKRLSDAERDGDRIYCVLHDILSSHDGNEDKNNFVVPSGAGQARLLSNIYGRTNFDPRRIFYVEAHGTGTPVGDPIEANCLGRFFNRSQLDPPLLIGSIKSNIGHTEGAAGVASLIKIIMCMHHRSIPSNMLFTSLNPKIEAQRYNIHVVQHQVPFPSKTEDENNRQPVALCVNSFGMGGTTTHAIVEEYVPKEKPIVMNGFGREHQMCNGNHNEIKQYFIFIFSTKTRESLNYQINEFNQWLYKKAFADIDDDYVFLQRTSQLLLLRRTISYKHAAVFVFANRKQLQEQIDAFLTEQAFSGLSVIVRPTVPTTKICFVFSGQGPQWWAMGRQLYESEPIFTQWIQLIDAEMSKINNGEWQLLKELFETVGEKDSRINDTNIAQPALFAIQVALAALLVSWNIYPSSIISHSAGDQAACFVAGRLTLQEAVRIVYHRSRLQNRNTRQGGRMLAVSMSVNEVKEKLLKDIEHLVDIAVVNSSRSVTLSGDEKTVDELQEILSTLYPNVFKARLRIENAFHSYQMDRFNIESEMLSSLKDIRGLPLQDSKLMFNPICAQAHLYSSVTGNELNDETPVDAHYWWTNVRSCVRFHDAMKCIQQGDDANIFLEISPHPVLGTSIRECYELINLQSPLILPTLKRKENEQITLLTSLAQMTTSEEIWKKYFHTRNISFSENQNRYFNEEKLFDDFPLYKFNLTPCWYESKESVMKRLADRTSNHPLLGVRQLTEHLNPTWRSLININLPEYAYLKDHRIQDAILFPAVAYLELAIAACHEILSSSTVKKQFTIVFEQIKFVNALILTEHESTEIFTQVIMPMRQWYIYSRPWSAAGSNCMRTSGMASNDILNSFQDQEKLNQYSLKQFTLHAHGQIEIDYQNNDQQKFNISSRINLTSQTWSTNEPRDVYLHLLTRGYQYGNSFQNVQSLRGTTTNVTAQINNSDEINNISSYYLTHPSILDTCFHPILALLPDNETTFLPISIQKFIVQNKSNIRLSQYRNIEICGYYHDNICGLDQEKTYTADMVVIPNGMQIDDSIYIFQGMSIQQVQGTQTGRWKLEKTLFERLNSINDLPNKNVKNYCDTIMKDYCMARIWNESEIVTNLATLFPSTEELIYNTNLNDISNRDLIESIKPLNELAACYAQMALKDLNFNLINQQSYPLLNACQSFSLLCNNEQVTWHSTQVRLSQLNNQFPRLKPLLKALNDCGSRLKEIFYGEQTDIDVFLSNTETEETFQQIKSIVSSFKTQEIFRIITQYFLRLRQGSLRIHHLRIFWISDNDCSDILPILDLLHNLSRETNLRIDLHCVNSDSAQLKQAAEIFEKYFNDHQITEISMIYDHAIDLFNSETLVKLPIESFDIIFSSNQFQISNEEELKQSLVNLRRLLIPNGYLILLELTKDIPLYFDLIFGLIDQWWSSTDNTRSGYNAQQWIRICKEINGFSNIQLVPSEYESTILLCQKSQSKQILKTLDERSSQVWLLFTDENDESFGYYLKQFLPSSNVRIFSIRDANLKKISSIIEVMIMTYKQLYIVFAWSLEQIPLDINQHDRNDFAFKQLEETICGTISSILRSIQILSPAFYPFIYVLTHNSQLNLNSNCNVISSPLIGLVRSLMTEYERNRLKLIDLQASSLTLIHQAQFVQVLVQYMIDCRSFNQTCEIALQFDTNSNQIKHLTWHYEMLQQRDDNLDKNQSKNLSIIPRKDADQHPFRLCVASSRFLGDLTWVEENRLKDLLPGQIEIRVGNVGLNFRDALKVRGLYPHTRIFAQPDQDQPHVDRDTEPGSDFVGTVVRSCPTTQFRVGDIVLGISASGVFHSHIIVDSLNVVRIPAECPLTYEQLSGMSIPCMTVIYSLKYRVNLQPNQTILIHAASGAAGQICIQYCQLIGARILATAGTDEKRRFLREYYGIEHVFNSRNMSFVTDVQRILPNGVDVIVNSLSGSFLKETMKLLSYHGHFIEWGKRDVFGKSDLSVFDLRSDCSFHVIDFMSLVAQKLDISRKLLQEMMDLFVQRKLKAIEPTVVYEPNQINEALIRLNSGITMGKTIVRLTSSDQPLLIKTKQSEQQISFKDKSDGIFSWNVCNQGTILISGGFGGLGLTMSRWMIEERAVKRIVLMSRRTLIELEQPSNPQYEDWLRLKQIVNKYNAHVDVVQADVTNFQQVYSLIEKINQTSYPVRGIFHSAVVSEDRTLINMTQDHLSRVLPPKVRGAWILHQVVQLTHSPIHFFLMFSSIRNHLLEVSSAGYNAGNQFLDALANYRMSELHLPALSISLPAVSGAGMFHRHKDALISLQKTQGFELVPTKAVFELIERVHEYQKISSYPVIFAVNWQTLYEKRHNLATTFLTEIVEKRYIEMKLNEISSTSSEINNTKNIDFNQKENIIERTRATVARLLGAPTVDRIIIDKSLVSQGMDSLGAVSLYNWLGQETSIFIPIADLLQGLSIEAIGTIIYDKLNERRQQQQVNLSTVEENDESFDDFNENKVKSATSSTYTGVENVICLQNSQQNSNLHILFCIADMSTNDNFSDHSKFLINKSSSHEPNDKLLSNNTIYMLRVPLTTTSSDTDRVSICAREMISQMRRIQPRGPYHIVAFRDSQEQNIAHAMSEQLKNYSNMVNVRLVLLDGQL